MEHRYNGETLNYDIIYIKKVLKKQALQINHNQEKHNY